MANIIRRPGWYLPEKLVTPENAFRNRREFLRQLGFTGAGLLAIPAIGYGQATAAPVAVSGKAAVSYPAKRNPEFNPKWALTQ